MSPWSVTAQSWQRPGRGVRWAYVIHAVGQWPYVSAYRYQTRDSALAAGTADALACSDLLLATPERNTL